jgi:lipopolysaccharide biosynthesis protein
MFWARVDAVADIFQAGFDFSDFPVENEQVDGTFAHSVERAWVYIAQNNGYSYLHVFNNCIPSPEKSNKKRIICYVHYDSRNIVDNHDIKMTMCLSRLSSELVFITNSILSQRELNKVKPFVSNIIQRDNKGYDFGAWRDALNQYGLDAMGEYDQLVLVNNSVFGPLYDLENAFAEMDGKNVDFWGITLYPEMTQH